MNTYPMTQERDLIRYILTSDELDRMRRAYAHGVACFFDSDSEGHDEGLEAIENEMLWSDSEIGLNTVYWYGV